MDSYPVVVQGDSVYVPAELAEALRDRVARLEEAVKKYRAACATPGVSYSSKAIAWAEVDRLLEGAER